MQVFSEGKWSLLLPSNLWECLSPPELPFSETSLRSPYGFCLYSSLLLFWDLKQLITALSSRFRISQRWIHWDRNHAKFFQLTDPVFCGNEDFCLCCLIYSVIMAEHPYMQSLEALEILIFILSSFQGFEIPRTTVLHTSVMSNICTAFYFGRWRLGPEELWIHSVDIL